MYSAVKIDGVKLYQSARKGLEVERPPRQQVVAKFRVWREDATSPNGKYEIVCSKGTYVRSLINDLVRPAPLCRTSPVVLAVIACACCRCPGRTCM